MPLITGSPNIEQAGNPGTSQKMPNSTADCPRKQCAGKCPNFGDTGDPRLLVKVRGFTAGKN